MNNALDLATLISFLVGTLLPVVVGLVTRVSTHPAVKGAVLLALAGVTGVLSQWLEALNSHVPFAWQPVVLSAVGAFAVGVTTHTAIWQHTPLSSTGTPFGTSPTASAAVGVLAAQHIPADAAPINAQHIEA